MELMESNKHSNTTEKYNITYVFISEESVYIDNYQLKYYFELPATRMKLIWLSNTLIPHIGLEDKESS